MGLMECLVYDIALIGHGVFYLNYISIHSVWSVIRWGKGFHQYGKLERP